MIHYTNSNCDEGKRLRLLSHDYPLIGVWLVLQLSHFLSHIFYRYKFFHLAADDYSVGQGYVSPSDIGQSASLKQAHSYS